jgi:hypothetical protein
MFQLPAFTVGFIMRFHASSSCSRDLIDREPRAWCTESGWYRRPRTQQRASIHRIWFEGVSVRYIDLHGCLRLFENVNKYLNIVSNVLPNKSSKFITLIWVLCNSSSETRAISE